MKSKCRSVGLSVHPTKENEQKAPTRYSHLLNPVVLVCLSTFPRTLISLLQCIQDSISRSKLGKKTRKIRITKQTNTHLLHVYLRKWSTVKLSIVCMQIHSIHSSPFCHALYRQGGEEFGQKSGGIDVLSLSGLECSRKTLKKKEKERK